MSIEDIADFFYQYTTIISYGSILKTSSTAKAKYPIRFLFSKPRRSLHFIQLDEHFVFPIPLGFLAQAWQKP